MPAETPLESASKPPVPRVGIVPALSAESSGRGCAQSAAGSFPSPLRNPARNSHCDNLVAAHRCARRHRPPKIDHVVRLNLIPRTSARPAASSRKDLPKNSLADCSRNVETLQLPGVPFAMGVSSFSSRIGFACQQTNLHPLSFYTQTFTSPNPFLASSLAHTFGAREESAPSEFHN